MSFFMAQDMPDIEGDIKYNISTFAASIGVKNLAKIATTVLAITYSGAISLPFIFPSAGFKLLPMSLGHSALLVYCLMNYFQMKKDDRASAKNFYKAIWNMFYLEYALYPWI